MSLTQRAPVWLALLVSVAAVVLTLFMDRISVAAQVSALTVCLESAESHYAEIQAQHGAIMDKLDANAIKLDILGLAVQQIEDRQDEVRRKLGIAR